jgi:cytochrome P450
MDIHNSSSPQELLRFARSPSGKRDPNSVYDRIRSLTPIWRDADQGFWYVFGWEDCHEIMRSSQFTTAHLLPSNPRFPRSASLQFIASSLPALDPPDHTRVRAVARCAFTPAVLKEHDSHVTSVIETAIRELSGRQSFDVVADYATVVTRSAIWELLGVPSRDHVRFGDWMSELFKLLSVPPPTDAEMDRIDAAMEQMLDYLSELIEQRRRHPGADLISALVDATSKSDEALSAREMTVTLGILLGGASDTTKTAISSGVRLMLEHAAQLQRLLADPRLETSAFEEILRVGGSVVLGNLRRAAQDVEIAGQRISRGELVFPVLAAANHDPARFDAPHRFDIGRSPNQHLAFGAGIHSCVGNMLARKVGARAVAALLRAFPTMRLVSDGAEVNTALITLRSWNRIPVAIGEG